MFLPIASHPICIYSFPRKEKNGKIEQLLDKSNLELSDKGMQLKDKRQLKDKSNLELNFSYFGGSGYFWLETLKGSQTEILLLTRFCHCLYRLA